VEPTASVELGATVDPFTLEAAKSFSSPISFSAALVRKQKYSCSCQKQQPLLGSLS